MSTDLPRRPSARSLARFLATLVLTLLAVAPASPPSRARVAAVDGTPRPNILLVLTDDQDLALGSLQYLPKTRALLAERGTTFRQYVVPLSLCCPSRATILTGLYPHSTEVYTNYPPEGGYDKFDRRGLEATTIGTVLHDAGYRTALLGKYLNEYPGERPKTWVPAGWDRWTSPVGGAPYSEYNYTLNQDGTLVHHGHKPADYLTDVLAAQATQFVAAAAHDGQPFFLYLATYAPHGPATPAPRHAALFPDLRAPRTASFDEPDVADKPAFIRGLPHIQPAEIAELDRIYRNRARCLQAVDEMVAGLVETLRAAGALENTWIVFTSDNGFHLGQHRLGQGKYTAYETDVRVPLLVRGPGVRAGAVRDALAESVDLAPTFADIAGVRLPWTADGRSLLPWLRGERPEPWRRVAFLEQFPFTSHALSAAELERALEPEPAAAGQPPIEHRAHWGLRTANRKFVEYDTGEQELYDLRADRDETTNLAARTPPATLAAMSRLAHELGHCSGDTCRALEERPLP